jgi:hypothetical protein
MSSRGDKSRRGWSDERSLLAQVERLWQSGSLLQERIEPGDLFPRRLVFKTPDSGALAHDFDAVRAWVADMERLRGFRVEWKTIRHRVIGANRIPAEVWLDDLGTAIALLGRRAELRQFDELVGDTRERAPQLLQWVAHRPLKALSLAPVWSRLLDFVLWRQAHNNPGVYLRQVDLPGLDSKFIEGHRAVLTTLLDATLPPEQIDITANGVRQFERRYGFRGKPDRVRYRLLDHHLARLPGVDRDITVTSGDFEALYKEPHTARSLNRVFITENEVNFLAFPDCPRSLVVFGGGYGFDALAQAGWLQRVSLVYWGDIDTHGFAILDQLRARFPQVQSLLMDEATLLSHKEAWVIEGAPHSRTLQNLTAAEQRLYQALCSNHYGVHLRLEQERIRYQWLEKALAGIGRERAVSCTENATGTPLWE